MKYSTQSVAYWYFVAAMALFGLQVIFGLTMGYMYVRPNFLAEIAPFNIVRMLHTNALIVWLLLGFFGAAYFLVPEEAEREIHSPAIAYLQLIILVVGTLGAVLTYIFNWFHGNYFLGTQGREFLEQPTWVKIGIVVAALLFLWNVTMTVAKGRKTAVSTILLMGLWGLALLFLFAFYNPHNIVLDKMYWWYVVHLWVEGVWELIMAAILAFLMLKLTGVDREIVEKWLYVIVATALFSGILGTGHHYFWIGLPAYWQWIGSIFSSFEVVPFFAMMSFGFVMVWKGRRDHPNKAAMLWSLGCTVLAFFGAGVWGFMHTLHGVNYYTHGTQITAAHGHLAFYGAYVCLVLAIVTYAMPLLRGRDPYNQVLNMASFWLLSGGMLFMTFTLTFAGTVQTHLQRVNGEAYMDVQDQLLIFYWMRFGSGVAVVVGALLFIYSVLVVRSEVVDPGPLQRRIEEEAHDPRATPAE
ncbi:nitric-oxide reductase large subunit [Paracoccus sp. S-4012]|uniref:cbb3-type cytochrome c oxidase subunit I n=1 Tax=Paracoccus sp. S-4012 TaxID=2665648 RepID=UPI0012B0BE64|nr:cbb3-type cytochrome c oxidase subunit I [Paracoccus sp. S-4012]MRX50476.1 nitric-oxide reductase large subunit [Paracoccus sp. S-4012]